MEDPNTSGDKTKQINQNQVIDKGQRIRPHQTSPTQDRGEENSQDCYEGTNHFQRKKATVTLLNWTLNTAWQHYYVPIVSSIFNSLWQLFQKFPTSLKLLTYHPSPYFSLSFQIS